MSDDNITLKIKMSMNNTLFDVSISKSATVKELKDACSAADKSNISAPEQNLVYKGRILADEKLLSDYNIANEHTIILVKKYVENKSDKPASEQTTSTTSSAGTQPQANLGGLPGFGGLGNLGGFPGSSGLGSMGGMGGMSGMPNVDPNQLSALMNNPMYMNMMSQMLNDPNTLNMVLNNPQIKPLLDANPQLRAMMSNPQMLQMMLNPQVLQSAMSMMGGNPGAPGGLGNLGAFAGMPQTSANPNPQSGSGSSTGSGVNNLFAGLGNLGNIGGAGDPKELYKEQNKQLKDMGFINEELNFQVLAQTFGNVDAAVERLLNMMN